MSRSDLALSVRGLGKEYRIARSRAEAHSTLAESLLARARRPLQRRKHDAFWALKDVSFDVNKGDVVGVIGRNGAGKSTLLKVLSRITQPTTGEVRVWGRIGSLLEVGTGFHPELTGRENIFLNGAILGMTRPEIRREFDAIVDFAGVEKFLDTPVKRYSSGMYVRLAFAVAAHLNPEVLIVDEVLAVGDAEFQRKCLGKMRDVAASGRTVLLVSHDQRSIADTCRSAILFEAGRVRAIGPPCDLFGLQAVRTVARRPVGIKYGYRLGEAVEILEPYMERGAYYSDEIIRLSFRVARREPSTDIINAIAEIVSSTGQIIASVTSAQCGTEVRTNGSRVAFDLRSPRLRPGDYTVNLALEEPETLDRIDAALGFEVLPPRNQSHGGIRLLNDTAVVLSDATCKIATDG